MALLRGRQTYSGITCIRVPWIVAENDGPTSVVPSMLFPGSLAIGVYGLSPGPDPSVYAYVKTTMQRNLFRSPLPD